jgi:hypothetical protein
MATGCANRVDDGYATLTALVLCTAVSVLCAGALSLGFADKAREDRGFAHLQRREAMRSAIMAFTADVAQSTKYSLSGTETVRSGDTNYMVTLSSQLESVKWPLDKMGDVGPAGLAKRTRLSGSELADRLRMRPNDDCVRTLFSDLGQVAPDKDLPTSQGALYVSTAKDGEVWRIRAVSGNRVVEQRIRFTGGEHLFDVISNETSTLGETPSCADLINAT